RALRPRSDDRPSPRPCGGRAAHLPGPDRLGVPPAQRADDAQIVGAAAGHGEIAVPAGAHQGLREVIRCLVGPTADKRGGAPRIEGATLDRIIAPLARLVYRQIEPPESLIRAPESRLRRPVQQGEARRILELGAPAEVRD